MRWIRRVLQSPASYSHLNPLELKPSEAPKSTSVRPTTYRANYLQGQLLTGPTFRNVRVTTARRGNARGPARVGIALFLDPVESEPGLQMAPKGRRKAHRGTGTENRGTGTWNRGLSPPLRPRQWYTPNFPPPSPSRIAPRHTRPHPIISPSHELIVLFSRQPSILIDHRCNFNASSKEM